MNYEPQYTDGVGPLREGAWVFYISGRGLYGPAALPKRIYVRLRGYFLRIPPRERGDSPLRCYRTREQAEAALEAALRRYQRK